MVLKHLLAPMTLAIAAFACGTPTYPEGFAPIEENTAPEPTDDKNLFSATGSTQTYSWVHARGVLPVPMAKAWAALQVADALVDRRRVDEWQVTSAIDPAVAASFRVHNLVHDVLTVDFDTEWRLDSVEGTRIAPTRVVARGHKTAGSVFIEVLEDRIELEDAGDTTRYSHVRHVGGATMDEEQAATYAHDLYDSLRAQTLGQPLPTYP